MNLVIISGLSGSGKTIALHTLEDIGFYCIDNLPIGLLSGFASEVRDQHLISGDKAAVSIDARNHPQQLNHFPDIIAELKHRDTTCKILFLQAENATLLKRFSETRRKHPLSGIDLPLADAIDKERKLLAPIAASADLLIDTSHTNLHQLRDLVRECLGKDKDVEFSLLLCLPNPHWQANLRSLTGLDKDVVSFLEKETLVQELYNDLESFLSTWIPRFRSDNRSYLSIAIGCTGGQHRSVYLVDRLAKNLGKQAGDVVVRHRELE